jgi:KDO2-lipid IV(A) lauroyltransferase
VVPFTQKRIKQADSYELELYPAFEDFPGESETCDAARINRFLESYLRQNPADYMWLHQRFRNRPQGERPFY